MKFNFSQLAGWLWATVLLPLAGLILYPLAVMATDQTFINTGTISGNPPQVDAINFYNSGTWNIEALAPYETANTLTYTNTGAGSGGGSMTAAPGWEFDLGPATTGSRNSWSSTFFNDNGCTIQALDLYMIILTPPSDITIGSSLLVQATNIINKGNLIATPDGQIKLVGSTVNLSRSTLDIPPIQGAGSVNNFSKTNFTPDTAIFDEYWGEGFTNLISSGVWNGSSAVSAASPNVNVATPCATSNAAPLLSFTPSFFAWTNIEDPNSVTNITNASGGAPILATNRYFRQAVFVKVSDPAIVTNNPFIATVGTNTTTNALIRFTPTGSPSNLFQTVSVWLHTTNSTDLYVVDTLGSLTNRGVLPNSSTTNQAPGSDPINPCTGPRLRPANYVVERVDNAFTNGSVGNLTPPPANFLYDGLGNPSGNPVLQAFSNIVVTADVSAYQAYVDDLAYNPSWDAISNLPGRIIIGASNNLDLTRTVISNAGPEVVIQANNLTGSAGAVISCQNLSYILGSSNGTVNVLNLATNGTLPALNGTVSLWSAEWTNYQPAVYFPGTTNSVTNTTELDFHVLLVDATGLSSTVPVTVQDLILQTNAVISDSMRVANSFFFGGQSLTLSGQLQLYNNIQNWNSALAPRLLYFTNNGILVIPNEADFGDDTAAPYTEFVNAGTILANGQSIRSLDIEIDSFALSQTLIGDFTATANSMEMNVAATIESAANLNLAANTLQLGGSLLSAGGMLNLSATNSLLDNGNVTFLECGNGFNLYVAPQNGNLSASTIIDVASSNSFDNIGPEVDHAWAGSDDGATASGTSGNVAIGTLSLRSLAPLQVPTFEFQGTVGNNAMYVNTLDLTQLGATAANITSFIQIDPGMKIYFATVNLGFTPPGGQSPTTFLQNQFPSQFVQDGNAGQSVGGGSSSNIVISSIKLQSVNQVQSQGAGETGIVLTWNSTAGATYSVLKTNVFSGSFANWPVIVNGYPPAGAVGGPLSYTDTTTTISPAFYRVRKP